MAFGFVLDGVPPMLCFSRTCHNHSVKHLQSSYPSGSLCLQLVLALQGCHLVCMFICRTQHVLVIKVTSLDLCHMIFVSTLNSNKGSPVYLEQ